MVAERWARESLSLPMYAELTDQDVDYVVDAVRDFLAIGANGLSPRS